MIREHHVETPARRIRYLEAGAGWPVVLVHAFPLSADMWRLQLESVPDGFRFITPDVRGFGGETPGPAGQPSTGTSSTHTTGRSRRRRASASYGTPST